MRFFFKTLKCARCAHLKHRPAERCFSFVCRDKRIFYIVDETNAFETVYLVWEAAIDGVSRARERVPSEVAAQ